MYRFPNSVPPRRLLKIARVLFDLADKKKKNPPQKNQHLHTKEFAVWFGSSAAAYLGRRLTNPQAPGADLRVRVGEMKLGMNMEYQARVDESKPRLPAEYGYRSFGEERKK